MYYKKSIGGVIAVVLLIIVSLITVIGFNSWYQSYSSKMYVDLENKNDIYGVNVETVIGNQLYIKSYLNKSIKSLQVNGEECYSDFNLTSGINNITINSCTGIVQNSKNEVIIFFNDKILKQTIFLKDNNFNIDNNQDDSFSTLYDDILTFYSLNNITKLNSSIGFSQTLIEGSFGVTQNEDHIFFTRGQRSFLNTPGNSTPYSAPGFTQNWSISQWFYTNNLVSFSYQNLWHQRSTDINENYGAVLFNCQNDEICITYAGGCISPIVCTPSVENQSEWYHLVTTYQNYNSTHSIWTLYLNNHKTSVFSTRKSNSRTYLNFGDWDESGNNILDGGMKNIGIWNKTLSDAEVDELFNLENSFSP